ncbi:MAG: FAD-dependent oxidoreductase [Desulfitobacterium sp.]
MMKRWICKVCGYIHTGNEPPERCPQCGAPKEEFRLLEESESAVEQIQSELPAEFRQEVDVLVVGSGAAAFSAAITAKNEGCSVIMLEKASEIGGTTRRSGGGFWIPNNRFQRKHGIVDNREEALKYMVRYSYPHLYQPEEKHYGAPQNEFALIEAMVDHGAEMTEYLENIEAFKLIEQINWTGKLQVDYQDHLPENRSIRGRVLFTQDEKGELTYGYALINSFKAWAEKNDIPILVDHRVTKILQDESGRAVGLEARTKGKLVSFSAKKGIIFGSGGYSHNPELMLHFQRGPIFGGCSAPTNTGDFIRLGGAIGAKLGNMSGAFRAQSVFESVLENPDGSNNLFFIPGDGVLEVNRYGKRVMDEKRNYTDRGMVHFVWDPNRAEWTNMLLFMVFDQRTADLWQGDPPYPMAGSIAPYMIVGNTLKELGVAISARLEQLQSKTGGFTLDEHFNESFVETVQTFNEYAKNGVDLDFRRGDFAYDREWTTYPPTKPGVQWPTDMNKNYTMAPLSEEGPYYAIILASSTLDTNGGPMINSHSQVLDYEGKPIPGLYGAGNCIASPTGNAYWGGGSTIGPALTFGYLAGLQVSKS